MHPSWVLVLGLTLLAPLAGQAPDPEATVLRDRPEVPWALLPGPMPHRVLLVRNTIMALDLVEELSTARLKPGDLFDLRAPAALLVDGHVVIPAGARAQGEVVDAQRGGVFGSPAKLQIAIRFAETGSGRIPLRFYKPIAGDDRTNEGIVLGLVPFVGLLAPFLKADDIIVPPGTRLLARVAKDLTLYLPPNPPGAPSATRLPEGTPP